MSENKLLDMSFEFAVAIVNVVDDALPAMWEPFRGIIDRSFFENKDELFKEMAEEPEYKLYFE